MLEAYKIAVLMSFLGNTLSEVLLLQERVEGLGPYGPLFFVGTVVSAEMLPLFPTQPLTIASGLLFGPFKVCHCAYLGQADFEPDCCWVGKPQARF